eukprot:3322831-Pyramimonas_sp.AAC.1
MDAVPAGVQQRVFFLRPSAGSTLTAPSRRRRPSPDFLRARRDALRLAQPAWAPTSTRGSACQ